MNCNVLCDACFLHKEIEKHLQGAATFKIVELKSRIKLAELKRKLELD